jgi:Flp pilus assembly pilin Flp
MRQKLIAFLKDESVAPAIEDGLIAAGIALAVIPVISGIAPSLRPPILQSRLIG